ncbi:CHAT domain-containing protein [Actinokineospora sp. 24-640]
MTIELDPGTPLADAVTAAAAAYGRGDHRGTDHAYLAAIGLADSTALAAALAADHVTALLALRAVAMADERCAAHLARFPDDPPLRAVRAQVRSARGEHAGAVADAEATIASTSGAVRGRLLRVLGLAAADDRDHGLAASRLAQAREEFRRAGHSAGLAAVERDRAVIAMRLGDQAAVAAVIASTPRTTADHLARASALRKELRYEEALGVVRTALTTADPALRQAVIEEQAVLLRLLRRDGDAELLTPLITGVARVWPEAAAGESPRFDRELHRVRRLIEDRRHAEADAVLIGLRPRTDHEVGIWHLAAGELELARHDSTGHGLAQAVVHLATAADRADTVALTEVRVHALRRLGLACFWSDDAHRAAECWAAAHKAEESIADRQVSDECRVRMLTAADTEHDHAVTATAHAAERDPRAAAAAVVAMEAARGATLVPGRLLPGLRDLDGAWRWLKRMTVDLAGNQAVWMAHATSGRVHHAVLTRDGVRLGSVAADITRLGDIVAEFQAFLSPGYLEMSARSGDFDRALAEIAALVGLDAALADIPGGVTRLAVVAGGPLGHVPWAGMSTADGHLVARYALSDLPNLTIRRPLRRRALGSRGDRELLLSPPDGLTMAVPRPGRTLLADDQATTAALAAAAPRHRVVRIDCHGRHDPTAPEESWLTLGRGERLTARQLQRLPLRGTVTLGACESGMAQPRGRDEPVGFVRAALHAGAAAVVAARWVAADDTAAALLDSFERHLRHLPRDVALQRAQLSTSDHPARWACWTLYGDPGRQTKAGPIRRLLRARADHRRHRAPFR